MDIFTNSSGYATEPIKTENSNNNRNYGENSVNVEITKSGQLERENKIIIKIFTMKSKLQEMEQKYGGNYLNRQITITTHILSQH